MKNISLFIRGMLLSGVFLCLCPSVSKAQFVTDDRLFSFEGDSVPSCLRATNSRLALSDVHYKDGAHSLEWTFEEGGTLELDKDLSFEPKDSSGKDLYLSAFIVWVYNEQPVDAVIRFEFRKDGRTCASFPFGINFKGWRAAWICYERDMEGKPEVGMNNLRVVAPNVKGRLFIDHLITGIKVDARQQTADVQVPFVNAATTNHWLVVYQHSKLQPDIPLTPVGENELREFRLLEKRFRDMIYLKSELTPEELQSIRTQYDTYRIVYKNNRVSGLPIFMVRASEAYERMIPDWDKDMLTKLGVEMKAYFDLMRRIAVAYNDSEPGSATCEELKHKFLSMYDHITDQGVAHGSCWGNIHHYGYSVRGLYPAYFLMKDVLREAGKLKEAEETLRWYSIANEVYVKPTRNGIDMDSFNTQTTGRMAGILMMEDTPEKLQYLRSFSRWIDYGCRPAPGLAGSFKADGSAFHHCNNYPAYAVGGLDGATNMIYLLHGTSFAVSELAHRTVKDVLLAMRFYCNKFAFPLSMSGRHPDGRGKLIPIHYATMAMAGSPDGKEEEDSELAAAYLRLVASSSKEKDPEYMPQVSNIREKKAEQELFKRGFLPEPEPEGNLALGYSGVSVHRRGNWSVVARGHSRYLWAAEHYLGANLYGRYLAHGSLQLFTASWKQTVTPATSGWIQEGFDWNRIPGVTSIRLPWELLQAKVMNVDTFSGMEEMLYSDEAFSGGLSQEGKNGNFGMVLHEHDKYNGTHRARKSFHFMEGVIVCLGSDIENKNADFPTETTVFQLAVTDEKEKAYWNSREMKKRKVWIDHLGTGYYVPASVRPEKNFPQYSRRQNTGEETKGDWVSLVIGHGKAPKGARYEYAVLPQIDERQMNAFVRKPSYRVLRQNRTAHIVHFARERSTSYVFFEKPGSNLPGRLLQRADTSCLVMTREEGENELVLTVAQPDLALYRGASDEAFDEAGKRIERSIYSRPWKENESQEIPVTLTLKGCWQADETSVAEIISANKRQTVIRFLCREGRSYDVRLRRQR